MSSKPKIVVFLEGGQINAISSNTDIEVVIVNYDNEDEDVVNLYTQDSLFKNGESYKLLETSNWSLSSAEKLVKEFLKENNF